jgi:hypothetical protein
MVKSCGQIFGGGSFQFLFSLLLVFLVLVKEIKIKINK